MEENLKVEYEASLNLLTHYDEREVSQVTYATGLSSALAGIVFGAKQLAPRFEPVFWPLVALLAGTVSAGLITVYLCMVENRLYLIFPARQANWLRAALLEEVHAMARNQMSVSVEVPAYRGRNAHTSFLILVSLQVGTPLGFYLFAAFYSIRPMLWALLMNVMAGVLCTIVLSVWSRTYRMMPSKGTARGRGHGPHLEDRRRIRSSRRGLERA